MKTSKFFVFVMAVFLTMFAGICFAQNRQAVSDPFNTSSLDHFNMEATWKDSSLLFKALYYNAPYPKHYYVLMVYKDGRLLTYRQVPSFATQASRRTKLDEEQLKDLENLIAQVSPREGHSLFLLPQEGEKHTVFVYLNCGNYERMNFIGEAPFNVQQIISFADDVLKKNTRSIYESETKLEN